MKNVFPMREITTAVQSTLIEVSNFVFNKLSQPAHDVISTLKRGLIDFVTSIIHRFNVDIRRAPIEY